MNKELLQQRIDEYNKKTENIVEYLKKIIFNIQCRTDKANDWNESELEELEDQLGYLDRHYSNVIAFIDGCTIVNDDITIKMEPLLTRVLPDFPKEWNKNILSTYKLNYTTEITSIVYLCNL